MAKSQLSPGSIGRFIERLEKTPPFFVYYVGAHSIRTLKRKRQSNQIPPTRLSLKELTEISGIPERTFLRIGNQLSWDNVKVKHIAPFCRACGVDLLALADFKTYVRKTLNSKTPYSHLNEPLRRKFNTLCGQYLKMVEDKNAGTNPPVAASPLPQNQDA